MIKKLQRKFVLIAMGSLFLVIVALIGTVNVVNLYQINKKADSLLTLLTENGGRFPEMQKGGHQPPKDRLDISPETPFETRYFVATADENGRILQIDTGHIAAVSSADAREYAEKVLAGRRTSGYEKSYKYLASSTASGTLLIFVDCGNQLRSAVSFLISSCGVALLSMLVVFLLVTIFSRRAIRPVIESMEKQKQFITDAGHEIKTPLAIISANTDVLELNNGPSEWTDSIRNQTKRLDGLVKNLLVLSRLEEGTASLVFTEFSLSDAVWDAAAPFETLAGTRGKHLELCIQPDITLCGDEGGVRQLVSILADNAVKYADGPGHIRISLGKSGKAAVLRVDNSCIEPPAGNLNRLFDRFYRADSSRTRETGGYGIGLSIARAIVEAHKGKIIAKAENQTISFIVTL